MGKYFEGQSTPTTQKLTSVTTIRLDVYGSHAQKRLHFFEV
jgi:hypothetical protein